MPRKRRPGRPRKRGRPRIRRRTAPKSDVTKHLEKLVHTTERKWSSKKPHTKKDRNDLIQTCGKECFLDSGMSNTNDYAICPKCSKKQCYCYPDCDALLSVKRTAVRRNLPFIEHSAQHLADELGCSWSEAVKYILINKYPGSLDMIY